MKNQQATIAGFTLKQRRAVFYRTITKIAHLGDIAFQAAIAAATVKALQKGARVISIRILEED